MSLGVHQFLFWSDLMTLDRGYLEAFLSAIRKEKLEKDIRWICTSRVDFVDEPLLRKMKAAGCWQMSFGLEFGDDDILRLAQKGGRATVAQGRRAIEAAARVGILTHGYFILGYPGETKATVQKTIDFACSLPLTFAHFYAATPYPGSGLYTDAVNQGWINENGLSQSDQENAVLSLPKLSPTFINDSISKGYRQFYLRPRQMARILSTVPLTFNEFVGVFKIGTQFYRDLLEIRFSKSPVGAPQTSS